MGVWKQNLNRKLSKNSIECSEEFSSTTQKPTTLVVTTTKKVGAEFCDDKEDGLYSHDTSCSLYNECYQGQTWEGRPCPAGLHQWSSSVLAILFLLLLAQSFSGNELSSSRSLGKNFRAQSSELLSEYMFWEQSIFEHSQTKMIKSIFSNHALVFLCKFYRLNTNFEWTDPGSILTPWESSMKLLILNMKVSIKNSWFWMKIVSKLTG